jgi:hypothetical protein
MKKIIGILLLISFLFVLTSCDMEIPLRDPLDDDEVISSEPTQNHTQVDPIDTIIPTEPVDPTVIDPIDELTAYMADFIDFFPEVINSSFQLPIYIDTEVKVVFNEETHLGLFNYESPFYDQEVYMKLQLKKHDTMIEEDVLVTLLSLDSGRNNNRIDIYTSVIDGEINRDEYVNAQIVVEGDVNGTYVTQHSDNQARIRGRGNSTWWLFPKKPYRINFSEDVSIYGMPASKSYVLLAEYSDKSLMRNVVTHKLSSLLSNIHYVIDTRYVEVYINNDYQGFICF